MNLLITISIKKEVCGEQNQAHQKKLKFNIWVMSVYPFK